MTPEHDPIFSVLDLSAIQTRSQLAAFVQTHRESRQVEYKPLRDLRSCGQCPVCRPANAAPAHPPADPSVPGLPIARAVTALANGRGGVLIIGANRIGVSGNSHRLEQVPCSTLTYDADWVAQTVAARTLPLVHTETRQIGPSSGRPVAYLVTVPASPRLHEWRDARDARHFTVRREATSVDMNGPEIEFHVKSKYAVEVNAEFRNEVAYSTWLLFDAVLNRPAQGGERDHLLDYVLQEDPLRLADMDPPLRRWVNDPRIDRAVLDMPSKMACWTSPHDIHSSVQAVGDAHDDLPHEGLDYRELRYLSACRILRQTEGLRKELSPFYQLESAAGPRWEETQGEFMSSDYDESYEQVFDRVAPGVGGTFDAQTKRLSIYPLSDALSLLLPLAFRVLECYAELVETYGTGVIGVYGPEFKGSFRRRRTRRRRQAPSPVRD